MGKCGKWSRRRPLRLVLASAAVLAGTAWTAAGGFGPAPETAWAAEAPASLQALLDAAPPGTELRVPAGTYDGPVVLRKPLRLTADGEVLLRSAKEGPVLSVETDGAQVSGFRIEDSRDDPDTEAVRVTGAGNELTKLTVRSMGYGIRLKGANGNRLADNTVEGLTEAGGLGAEETEPGERGNGIDLLESDGNVMTGNRITNMFDGIYIEKGKGNRMEANTVTGSRYGYHLMFDKDTVIEGNTGSRNVTGAMIMSDEGARVSANDFAKQSENATAQGILLFDVKGVRVENNRVEGNRLGLYAQGMTQTEIRGNRFLRNFTGIQMTGAESSTVEGNAFIANVVQAQADAGKNNRFERNYWDDHDGLDLQGDGLSDLAYRSDPFFLSLTAEQPAYQLFFGAPGLGLLQDLFHTSDEEVFTDTLPLMKPPADKSGTGADGSTGGGTAGAATALSAAMLLAGAGLFWWGGKRRI